MGDKKVFINVSNHKHESWSKEQMEMANSYGKVIDLPFPAVNPSASIEEIKTLAYNYFEKIKEYDNPVVMIQGEYTFTYKLVSLCLQNSIKAVSACTERVVTERICEDGTTEKNSVFKFVQFREYT